jgi:hypothetical protein
MFSAARPRAAAAALNIPVEAPAVDSERTQLAQSPFGAEPDPFADLATFAPPPPVVPKRRPTGQLAQLANVDAPDDGVQWYLALDGNRTGPFSRQKLVDKLMPLAKNADVHIWNEKLDGWKPPKDVAEIAGEIARRRGPAPPPLPGAPRRPTPPPMPPLAGLGQAHPPVRKPTGPHAPPSPVAHGPGGAGSKLPPPGGVHPALAARGEHAASDPSSMLETPAPMAHGMPHVKTNGVGGTHAHAPPKPVNSDVMQMLNLPGGAQAAGGPPKLISLTEVMQMGGATTTAPTGRSKSTVLLLALLAVIAAIVGVVAFAMKKPPRPPVAMVRPPPPPAPEPPVVEQPPEQPPPPVVEQPPQKGKGGKLRGKLGKPLTGKSPGLTQPQTDQPPAVTGGTDASRFRDNHNLNITGGGGTKLPAPDQAAITKVISNNRAGIKICYQRALTRDNSLTHGKLSVKLSIGISGRVKHVGLDGPAQFRILLEPCIKEVVQRWVFPQASEEYGTEFPLVFQGNE